MFVTKDLQCHCLLDRSDYLSRALDLIERSITERGFEHDNGEDIEV